MKILQRMLTMLTITVLVIELAAGMVSMTTQTVVAEGQATAAHDGVQLNELTDDMKKQLDAKGLPLDYQGKPIEISTFDGIFTPPKGEGFKADSKSLMSNFQYFANEVLSGEDNKNGAIWSTQPLINFDKNWQASMYINFGDSKKPGDGMTLSISGQEQRNRIGTSGQSIGVWPSGITKRSVEDLLKDPKALHQGFSIVMDTYYNGKITGLIPHVNDDSAFDSQVSKNLEQYLGVGYPGLKSMYTTVRKGVASDSRPTLRLVEKRSGDTLTGLDGGAYFDPKQFIGGNKFTDKQWHKVELDWTQTNDAQGGGILTFTMDQGSFKVRWTQAELNQVFFNNADPGADNHKAYIGFTGSTGDRIMKSYVLFSTIPGVIDAQPRMYMSTKKPTKPLDYWGADKNAVTPDKPLTPGQDVLYNYNVTYSRDSIWKWPQSKYMGNHLVQTLEIELPYSEYIQFDDDLFKLVNPNDPDHIDIANLKIPYDVISNGQVVVKDGVNTSGDRKNKAKVLALKKVEENGKHKLVIEYVPPFQDKGIDGYQNAQMQLLFSLPAKVKSDYKLEEDTLITESLGEISGDGARFDFSQQQATDSMASQQLQYTIKANKPEDIEWQPTTPVVRTESTVSRVANGWGNDGRPYNTDPTTNWYELGVPEGGNLQPIDREKTPEAANTKPMSISIEPFKLAEPKRTFNAEIELAFLDDNNQVVTRLKVNPATGGTLVTTVGEVRRIEKARVKLGRDLHVVATDANHLYQSTITWQSEDMTKDAPVFLK